MPRGRVLRIKYESRDIGFLDARLDDGASAAVGWRLTVSSPENLDDFRDDLAHGRSVALSLFVVDGRWYAGQAAVACISDGHLFPIVTLSGQGPLRKA